MLNKKMWISEVVWPSKGNEGAQMLNGGKHTNEATTNLYSKVNQVYSKNISLDSLLENVYVCNPQSHFSQIQIVLTWLILITASKNVIYNVIC